MAVVAHSYGLHILQNIQRTPAHKMWLGLGISLVLCAIFASGCGFDPTELDGRRCKNDDACLVAFGTEEEGMEGRRWRCIQGYCQERRCVNDTECSDGVFCNGDELCDVDGTNDAAGIDGCVPSVRNLDDSIACTRDYCDEALDQVLHDPADCPCSQEGDPRCSEMIAENDEGCTTAACNPATFECDITRMPAGTECTDLASCTQNTVCNDDGRCIANLEAGGVFNDSVCDDGFFCNGAERCTPNDEASETDTGCLPGTPPTPDEADDGIACTEVVCDEENDQVIHTPTPACACSTDADCAQPNCIDYVCNPLSFTCEESGNTPADALCDDGIACTGNEACDGNGACIGTPSDLYCELNTSCTSTPMCDPDSDSSDTDSGCVCADR